jgi:phospholipid/cholesterol/gamma-HCH transport system permease protein
MLTSIGHWVLERVRETQQMLRLIGRALLCAPSLLPGRCPPVFRVFFKQVYFSGFESLRIILPVSLAIGIAIIAQVMSLMGTGNESLAAKILVWSVVRELGPLLTAIIVIARSGAAIATEIGSMRNAGEIEALEVLGIPPEEYLLLPRLAGMTLAVAALTIYFEAGAIIGGVFVASFGWHIPIEQFSQGLYAALSVKDLVASLGKSLLFGLFICAACCQQGYFVGRSVTMIPRAASSGVIHSLFLVFFFDGLVALVMQSLPA